LAASSASRAENACFLGFRGAKRFMMHRAMVHTVLKPVRSCAEGASLP